METFVEVLFHSDTARLSPEAEDSGDQTSGNSDEQKLSVVSSLGDFIQLESKIFTNK